VAAMSVGSSLQAGRRRAAWALRRAGRLLVRQIGGAGLLAVLCGGLALAVWLYQRQAERSLSELAAQQAGLAPRPVQPTNRIDDDDTARLAEFQRLLIAPDDIPTVVQDLIGLAQQQGLRLPRGEYKAQAEALGGFLRYRMNTPIKGPVEAIHAFIQAALRAHRTLALESVQFRREQVLSNQVEARIQWTLLTRLPERGRVPAPEVKP